MEPHLTISIHLNTGSALGIRISSILHRLPSTGKDIASWPRPTERTERAETIRIARKSDPVLPVNPSEAGSFPYYARRDTNRNPIVEHHEWSLRSGNFRSGQPGFHFRGVPILSGCRTKVASPQACWRGQLFPLARSHDRSRHILA